MGASWGLTIPLTKLAVSEDYQEFGLIFWQQMICFGILVFWVWWSGCDVKGFRSDGYI